MIVAAAWNVIYDGSGPSYVPAYLGPENQSLCSNCPVSTGVNQEFQLTFQITNRDLVNHTVSLTTGYVGCGVPFYLESLNVPQPFVLSSGQTFTVVMTLWPDSATPGNWTFHGNLWTE